MTTETQKKLVLDYVERIWNLGDVTALDEMTTPTFLYWLGGQPGRDHRGMRQLITMLHTAFPDWRVQVVEIIAEKSTVVIRWEGKVTHLGDFQGIPATGKQIAVNGINIYHVVDGKVATEWEQTHTLGMLQQMGVLSST